MVLESQVDRQPALRTSTVPVLPDGLKTITPENFPGFLQLMHEDPRQDYKGRNNSIRLRQKYRKAHNSMPTIQDLQEAQFRMVCAMAATTPNNDEFIFSSVKDWVRQIHNAQLNAVKNDVLRRRVEKTHFHNANEALRSGIVLLNRGFAVKDFSDLPPRLGIAVYAFYVHPVWRDKTAEIRSLALSRQTSDTRFQQFFCGFIKPSPPAFLDQLPAEVFDSLPGRTSARNTCRILESANKPVPGDLSDRQAELLLLALEPLPDKSGLANPKTRDIAKGLSEETKASLAKGDGLLANTASMISELAPGIPSKFGLLEKRIGQKNVRPLANLEQFAIRVRDWYPEITPSEISGLLTRDPVVIRKFLLTLPDQYVEELRSREITCGDPDGISGDQVEWMQYEDRVARQMLATHLPVPPPERTVREIISPKAKIEITPIPGISAELGDWLRMVDPKEGQAVIVPVQSNGNGMVVSKSDYDPESDLAIWLRTVEPKEEIAPARKIEWSYNEPKRRGETTLSPGEAFMLVRALTKNLNTSRETLFGTLLTSEQTSVLMAAKRHLRPRVYAELIDTSAALLSLEEKLKSGVRDRARLSTDNPQLIDILDMLPPGFSVEDINNLIK